MMRQLASDALGWVVVFASAGICFVALALVFGGCTDGPNAARILWAEGFTDVEITGYRFTTCDKNDTFATGFRARKHGRVVTGAVCSGWIVGGFGKGHTVRYD